MSAVGGSIRDVNIRGRLFAVAADAKVERGIGGPEASFESNGDGTGRLLLEQKGWMLGGITLSVDGARGDHEFLRESAKVKDFYPTDCTFADGSTWMAKGHLTGAIKYDSSKATCEVTLEGPHEMTQQ